MTTSSKGNAVKKKKKKDTKTTSFEEAVTKLTDSAGAQKTPSKEGKLDCLIA